MTKILRGTTLGIFAAILLVAGCKGKPAADKAPVAPASAQATPAATKAGPPVDLSKETQSRIVGSLRQALNIPDQVSLSVGSVSDSEIPGFQKGLLSAAVPGRPQQSEGFYISTDRKWFFLGKVIDLSVDPVAAAQEKAGEAMKKIDMTDVPSRGPADAKVTIVEYSDFQCPFCARAYATIEGDILKEYGKKVRFVYKNFPLVNIHPWAESAAIGADCAYKQSEKAFWTVYNNLYKNQASITAQNLRSKLLDYVKEAGVKGDAFAACYDKQETRDRIQKQMQEANALGVQSTPSFFVNGTPVVGAQPKEVFEAAIKKELSK